MRRGRVREWDARPEIKDTGEAGPDLPCGSASELEQVVQDADTAEGDSAQREPDVSMRTGWDRIRIGTGAISFDKPRSI